MDIQGEELRALQGSRGSLARIKHLIVGTHGKEVHDDCVDLLESNGCTIQFQNWVVANQPDGIIAATGPAR